MSQLESRHISSFLSLSICPTLSSDPGSILTPSFSLCPSPLCASFSPIICLLLSPLPLPFHFFLTNHESPWISFSNWLVQLLKHIVCAHTHTHAPRHVYLHTLGRPTDSYNSFHSNMKWLSIMYSVMGWLALSCSDSTSVFDYLSHICFKGT